MSPCRVSPHRRWGRCTGLKGEDVTDDKPGGKAPVRARAKRRRRRENVEGGRTAKTFKVGVSDREHLALALKADALGWSVPRLLVESALAEVGETATDRRELLAELFAVARYLGAVSNNINQIARAANVTGEVAEELDLTLDAVRRTAERVDQALVELGVGR